MSTQRMVGPNEPVMVAWKRFQATEEYANAMRWGCEPTDTKLGHLEGAIWAAFSMGFAARAGALETERDRLYVALNAMLADGELQRTDPVTFYYIRAALAAASAPARIPDEGRRGWPDALSAGDVEPYEEQEAIEAAHENEATIQPDRGYRRWACTVMCLELGAELQSLTMERAREVGRQAVDRLIKLYGYDSMEFAEGRALWHSMVIALGIGFDPAPGREGAAGNPRWDLRGTLAETLGVANDPRVQRAAGVLGHIGAELAAPAIDNASIARELRADEAYDPGPSDDRC